MFPPSVSLIPVFLYAETHFRFFPGFPSLLYKREPEIVFDLPYRCDPGKDLPIFLVVNDIKRFPVEVTSVSVVVSQKENTPLLFKFENPGKFSIAHRMSKQSKVFCFWIKRSTLPEGSVFVNCKASVSNGRRCWIVINDNFVSSSKLPFSCVLAEQPLPGSESCAFGDLHVHSQYSQSHVEFGPPIAAIDIISDTCGLDFVAITDHSYDLCCKLSDYLQLDDSLERWKFLSDDLKESDNFKSIIILGEEITAINSQKQAVHLCALGLTDFIPGSGDGARTKKLETLEIAEVVKRVHDQGGLAMAAHPGSRFGFLQRIFLGRGNWLQPDFKHDLDAIQAINNGFGISWNTSKQLWIRELLKGRRLPIVAGNDAHGDFNRYRYISVPFVTISENFSRYLSSCRTGIYKETSSIKDVMNAIRSGETFVTNGPFLSITYLKSDTNIDHAPMTIPRGCNVVTVSAASTSEFGMPRTICLFGGGKETGREIALFSDSCSGKYNRTINVPLESTSNLTYLRAEVTCTRADGSTTFAATSPHYYSKQ
jgi:hypothetical protein